MTAPTLVTGQPKEKRSRWDSNPQSPAPEADALSIRPRDPLMPQDTDEILCNKMTKDPTPNYTGTDAVLLCLRGLDTNARLAELHASARHRRDDACGDVELDVGNSLRLEGHRVTNQLHITDLASLPAEEFVDLLLLDFRVQSHHLHRAIVAVGLFRLSLRLGNNEGVEMGNTGTRS